MQDLYNLAGTGTANQAALWAGTSSLAGDTGFTYDSATDIATLTGGLKISALTQNRVLFSGASGLLSDDADFTFNTSTNFLTADGLNLADTSNQIVFQSGGVTGTLSWTPATSGKTITFPNATGRIPLTADADGLFTSGSVLYADSNGLLAENNAAFFWDNANTFLTITNSSAKQLRLAYDATRYWDLRCEGPTVPNPQMAFYMEPALATPANQVFMNFRCTDLSISVDGTGPFGQGTPNFGLVGGSPGYNLQETDAGADAKTWTHYIETGVLTYNLLNDANNATSTWFTMTRSGITPGTATYYCKLDVQYNSNPQLRLTYTASSVYVDLQADAAGGLIFQPTGTYCGIFKSAAGSTLTYYASNTDNSNTASHSSFAAVVGGSSGGDPFVRYEVTGVTNWSEGVDNSDSDKWKVSNSSTLGTNDYLTITTAGVVTIANTFNINSAVWLQFSGANTIFSSAGVGLLLQQPNGSSATIFRDSSGNSQWTIAAGSVGHLTAGSNARFSHGTSALATNATEGFFHMQTCAGAPSGTPASIPSGQAPFILDTTNDRLYFYYDDGGGAGWHYIARTA